MLTHLIDFIFLVDKLIDELFLFLFFPNLINKITVSELSTEPSTKPSTKPSTESSTKPVTEPSTKPVTEPLNKQSTKSSTKASTEPSTEQLNKTIKSQNKLNPTFDVKQIISNNNLDIFMSYYNLGLCKIDNAIIEQILSKEKYDFVQFIINHYYPIDDNILNLCIKSRNKEQIKKLLDLGCKWTIYSFSYGASTLDITLLKWLKDNGCFWGILHPDHLTIIKSNNNIITWLKENKCNWILC